MSSSKPRHAASSSGDLPADALYEVLLRIPAKDLCRFRAVCPVWRALTSDPLFVAAHKSRTHGAPALLATAYRDDNQVSGVAISDPSGNVVKRIAGTEYEVPMVLESSGKVIGRLSSKMDIIRVERTRLDLIIFHWHYSGAFWVLNPVTEATIALPAGLAHELELEGIDRWGCPVESCAFGQVSSTREYKALRVSKTRIGNRQVCEVITFDDTNHGSWRRKQGPPSPICASRKMSCVVVDGVVYFLMDFFTPYFETGVLTIEPGSIASFNLETEEWMGVLRGPEPVQSFMEEDKDYSYIKLDRQLSLAELNGCLVMVHNMHNIAMDLWFLTDFGKGIWVKKYSMPSHIARFSIHPLLMLDDGRIFFSGEDYQYDFLGDTKGFLRSYDPRNDTYTDVLQLKDSISIGIYEGSLLSL